MEPIEMYNIIFYNFIYNTIQYKTDLKCPDWTDVTQSLTILIYL